MRYKGVTKFIAGLLAAAMVVTGVPVSTLNTADAKTKTEKLSYKGYTKVWEDNFDGNALNMKDWNVETHEPGWVNAELQEYTESGNIKVSDGKLTIIPKRTKNADGTYSYTSGRINTQNKHDFKYGIMEARMKFPKGQGYLPAFWMMPTNENLYGQWPKCGEIDIAEVMGQDTKKIYGTIHYGEPHAQSQGTEVLKKGNFADDWHTCAVEWEPGSIKWYVDGVLYHEEHSWFTKTPGQGEVTYPAPFDQNFYIIFNLAIGGSWVGYPDKTTDYNSNFQVDYVKVYQKKNYNDNVKKPEKKVVLKKADKKGNFISNADFSKNEKLDGSANWQFMTAQSGEGSAAIKNKKIEIKTKNAGKEEYSIQLVQPGLPIEKGATYEVSFDAYADKARTMKVDISGPDMNYMRYFNDTAVNLTTKKKSYKFKFTMNEDTDANSRLEFNMGAQGSTANVYITNVKVKKIKSASKAEVNKKTVLADGNLVYNGKFQEGDKRLGYWNIKKKNASVSVSNKDYNDRKLVVKLTKDSKAADVKVYQTGLAFEANKEYSVSFDASATTARTIKVKVAGKTFSAKLNSKTKSYEFIMKTGKKLSDKNVVFYLGGKKGTVYLDNVVVTENSLIKNGSFNAGTTGWTEWHDTSEADLSFVIDSLSEDNAADFTIKKTGSEDWKIQLKQENVPLEKDQYYKLTFKAKSSKTREMRAIMQGLEDKNWEVYSGENTVKLTSKYKTYTKVFQMTADSDPKSQISFCLGAVAGKAINTQHRVCIDDVNLEVISEKEAKKYLGNVSAQDSLIKNGNFAKGTDSWSEWHETAEADAQYKIANGEVHFTVNKTGLEDWKIQFKQENIKLEEGHYYKLTFKGKSDLERKIRATVQGGEARNYSHYTGDYFVTLKKDYQTYEHVFKMNEATDDKTSFQICMGAVGGAINQTHNMYFKDFSLVEISEAEGKKLAKNTSGGGGGVAGGGDPGNTPPAGGPAPEVEPVEPKTSAPNNTELQTELQASNVSGSIIGNVATFATSQTAQQTATATVAKLADVKKDSQLVYTFKGGMTSGDTSGYSVNRMARIMGLNRASLMDARIRSGETEPKAVVSFQLKNGKNEKIADFTCNGQKEFELLPFETDYKLIAEIRREVPDVSGAKVVCTMKLTKTTIALKNNTVGLASTNDLGVNANMIRDGNFNKDTGRWVTSVWGKGASANIQLTGEKAIITVNSIGHEKQAGKNDYDIQPSQIQLKQKHIGLTKGATYQISITGSSTVARPIKIDIMSADFSKWYGGGTINLTSTSQTHQLEAFTVDQPTSDELVAIISMGEYYNDEHVCQNVQPSTIELSDFKVTKTADVSAQDKGDISPSGVNCNKIGNIFTNRVSSDGAIILDVTSTGAVAYAIQVGNDVSLSANAKYEYSYDIVVDKDWKVNSQIQDPSNGYSTIEGSYKEQALTKNTWTTVTQSFASTAAKNNLKFNINLGGGDLGNQMAPGEKVKICIRNIKFVKKEGQTTSEGDTPTEGTDENQSFAVSGFTSVSDKQWQSYIKNQNLTGNTCKVEDGKVIFDIKDAGEENYYVQLKQTGIDWKNGTKYKVSFNVVSTATRGIEYSFMSASNDYYDGAKVSLTKDVVAPVDQEFTAKANDSNAVFQISLGKYADHWDDTLKQNIFVETAPSTITITDFSLTEVQPEPTPTPDPDPEPTPVVKVNQVGAELLTGGTFDTNDKGSFWFNGATESYVDKAIELTVSKDFDGGTDAFYNSQLGYALNDTLKHGKTYLMAFRIKADESGNGQTVKYGVQHDGGSYEQYAETGECTVTKSWQNIRTVVTMPADFVDTTPCVLYFNLAKESGTGQKIYFDDISLKEFSSNPTDVNMLKNPTFDGNQTTGWTINRVDVCNSEPTINAGVITFSGVTIPSGQNDGDGWKLQLKNEGMLLEKGSKYKISFYITSSKARSMKMAVMSKYYEWYGGADISLNANERKLVEATVDMTEKSTDVEAEFAITLGYMNGAVESHDLTLSDFSLVKIAE